MISLERTIVDCARLLSPESALVIADSGLRIGAKATRIRAILQKSVGKRGIVRAREILSIADERSESPGESLVRYAAWAGGTPIPEPQITLWAYGRQYRIDLGWRSKKVGIEFDGAVKYSGLYGQPGAVLDAQARRQRDIESTGWKLVRVTWEELNDPVTLGMRLQTAYRNRG